AAQNGHKETVEILLKSGANPDIQYENGWTALMFAQSKGHTIIVAILRAAGATK
ncbi:MAG: ankyrin repeat domain-containing protein, partial [Endomicrobium sp.]|nr:ankyrin repeat domain-containing protein [Endomicrobium sp.]